MNAIELRTLDGPNLFMLRPAIKIEIRADDDEESRAPARFIDDRKAGRTGPMAIAADLAATVKSLHQAASIDCDEIVVRELEDSGHAAVAFSWTRRRASRAIGDLAWQLVSGNEIDVDAALDNVRRAYASDPDEDDLPELILEDRRRVPTIGITGTNGKTTTTRLVSSILRHSGGKVGWTSSSGVMIEEEMVLEGDYTGPSGAIRVFDEPDLDFAVLETARGGILLRGLGYEHNDVSVMTNISADHMGMHGVYSLDVISEVKSVVTRVTLSDGFAVLNADDSRVLAVASSITAKPFLFSKDSSRDEIGDHVANGGWALVVDGDDMVWHHDGQKDTLVAVDEVPITFGGRAEHMVENALAAAAACLAIGIAPDVVRSGLKTFRNRPDQNRGRLNVYELDGATIVVDFAHNEAGLNQLLRFSRKFCGDDGQLVVVVGTAGDRDDAAIRAIGEVAASSADQIIIKDSEKYLRGREPGEMPSMLRSIAGDRLTQETSNERAGFYAGLELMNAGDVLAVMCIEDYDEILAHLDEHATPLS